MPYIQQPDHQLSGINKDLNQESFHTIGNIFFKKTASLSQTLTQLDVE